MQHAWRRARDAADRRFGARPGARSASCPRRRAAAAADRAERDPRRRRRRERRVHPLPVHRLPGRARLPVGGGRRRRRPVLHQHGDRALHARDRRDRDRQLPAAVEARGARSSPSARCSPRCGPAGRRPRRPSRTFAIGGGDPNMIAIVGLLVIGAIADRLAGRLPDGREAGVHQGRARSWCSSSSRCSPRSRSTAFEDTSRRRHELRHVPERDRARDPRRRARRGRRRRRQQPRAEQLDPRQGLRHGPLRPAHRLPDHRPRGGRAGRRAPRLPDRRGEPRPLAARGGSARTSSSSCPSRASATVAIIVFSLVAYSTVYQHPACPTAAGSTSSSSRATSSKETVGPWFGTLFWGIGAVSLFAASMGIVDYVARLVADVLRVGYLRESKRWKREQAVLHGRLEHADLRQSASCSLGSISRSSSSRSRRCLGGAVMCFYFCFLLIAINRKFLPEPAQDPRLPARDPVRLGGCCSARCTAIVAVNEVNKLF